MTIMYYKTETRTDLHWRTIPTRRLSILQPTPAEISVNFTPPCSMASASPSLGEITRLRARSDFAPTRMHLLPARWLVSDRKERLDLALSEHSH